MSVMGKIKLRFDSTTVKVYRKTLFESHRRFDSSSSS